MITDAFLAEPIDNLVLVLSSALNPSLHVLHHLTLDLGVGIMEVGMEQALEDLLYDGPWMAVVIAPGLRNKLNAMPHYNHRKVPGWFIEN